MTATTFDAAAFKQAIEERDAAGLLALYAEHAEVRLVDRDNPPRSPRVLQGKDQIRAWIEDICDRDMTHRVEQQVASADRAAFTEACRYPDGTNVLCVAMLELSDGYVVHQTGIQAWDG
jgi:ketosteroid isomerase-like protein